MATKLKATARYLNKYEQAHNVLSNATPFFNEEDWTKVLSGNDASNLDMYIDALTKSTKLDYAKFLNDYKMNYANSDTRLGALYNEIYGERDTMIDVDDGYGGKRTISKYDYYKENIVKQNEFLAEQHLSDVAKERDPNVWATIVGVSDNFLVSLDKAFTATAETFVGLANLAPEILGAGGTKWVQGTDGEWRATTSDGYLGLSNAPYYFRNVGNKGTLSEIPVSDELTFAEALDEFNREFTYIYNDQGELTTFGKYAGAVSDTMAQMLVASWTGGGVSKLAGITGKAASALTTGIFYAPSTAQNISDTYRQFAAQGLSISTNAIIANAVAKSALEASIEIGLGKIFGASGLDRWIFGRGPKAKAAKSTLWSGLKRAGINIAQEPLEEVTQEMSNVLVDNIFGLVIDENFGELSSLSAQNLIDAAVVAFIISGAHTTVDVMRTESKTVIGDGGVEKLGKFAAYDYNLNMQSFAEAYQEAQDLFVKTMSSDRVKMLPSYRNLRKLQERKDALVKRKTELSGQISRQFALNEIPGLVGKSTDTARADIAAQVGDLSAGLSSSERILLNQKLQDDPNYKEVQFVDERLKELDSRIQQEEQVINSEGFNEKRNSEHNRKSRQIRRDYIEAFQQMYAAAQMLTAFSNQIGEERLNYANDILTKATEYMNAGKYSPDKVERMFNDLKASIQLYGIELPGDSFWSKLKESGATTLRKIFKRETHKEERADSVQKAIEKIFERCENAENVIVTKDGKNAVESKDGKVVSVPEKELNLGADMVIEDLAERQLAEGLVNGEYRGVSIDKIVELYKSRTGKKDVSVYEVALNLFFDTPFFSSLLWEADIDMYQFLSSLISIEKAVVAKDVRNEVYKKKVRQAVGRMKTALITYLKNQHNADYRLDFFSENERREIAAARWCKNLAQRVIQGKTLSQDDVRVLNKRIDNIPRMSDSDKKKLKEGVVSKSASERNKAMNKIAEAYREVFLGAYDGVTYLPLTSASNKAFNYFLQSKGLTLQTLFELSDAERNVVIEVAGNDSDENVNDYRREQFEEFTNNRYSYTVENGTIVTSATDDESHGYSYAPTSAIILGEDIQLSDDVVIKKSDRTFQVRGNKYNGEVRKLLDGSVDAATSAYLSIDDVINHFELLSKAHQQAIIDTYGSLTSQNTFLYLRNYFIEKIGTISVAVLADGTYTFVDIAPMQDVLKSDWSTLIDNLKDGVKIWDLLNDKYKIPYLENAIIKVRPSVGNKTEAEFVSNTVVKINDNGKILATKGDLGYDGIQGTEVTISQPIIYISPDMLTKSTDYLQFVITHEIQHAFQVANRQNMGGSGNFLFDLRYSGLSEKEAKKLFQDVAADIASHRPELFRKDGKNIKPTSDEGLKIANDFIYYCSGESTAYGLDASDLVDFYPVLVNYDGFKRTVTMPWGTTIELSNLAKTTASAIADEQESVIESLNKTIELTSQVVTADNVSAGMGSFLIRNDGTIFRREIEDDNPGLVSLASKNGYIVVHVDHVGNLFPGDSVISPATGEVLYFPNDDSYDGTEVIYAIELPGTPFGTMTEAQKNVFLQLGNGIDVSRVLAINNGSLLKNLAVHSYYSNTLYDFVNDMLNTDARDAIDDAHGGQVISPLSLEEAIAYFNQYNEDEEVGKLSVKVFEAYRKMLIRQRELGEPEFKIQTVSRYLSNQTPIAPDETAGVFNSDQAADLYGVSIHEKYIDDPDTYTPTVILHEMIHSVTATTVSYVEKRIKDTYGSINYLSDKIDVTGWSRAEKGALVLLQVYQSVTKNDMYGFKNASEMVAELANPKFREYLKSQTFGKPGGKHETFWSKVKNAIFRIIGWPVKDALSATELALENILTKPIQHSSTRYYSSVLPAMASKSPEGPVKPTSTPKRGRRQKVEVKQADGTVKAVFPHRQTKGTQKRKYIGSKASKGTVLEPFAGQKLGEKLESFIVKSAQPEYDGIDAGLAKKIKNGTLTTQDIMTWFFQVDTDNVSKSDEITFNLINDSIFHNKFISSFEQLDEYIQVRTANSWAMRAVMNELGYKDKFAKIESPETYDVFFEIMETNKALQKKFTDKLNDFTVFEILDFKNLRRLWMQWYDGSVASAGYIAGVAKAGAEIISRHGSGWSYSSGKAGGVSLSQSVGKSKEGKTTRTREEVTASKDDYDDLVSFATENQMYVLQEAYKVVLAKQIKEEVENNPEYSSMDKIPLSVLAEHANRIKEAMSDIEWNYYHDKPAFNEMYRRYVLNDTDATAIAVQSTVDELAGEVKIETSEDFIKEREEAREVFKGAIRHKSIIVNNIRSINRTIKRNLNRAQRKLFLRDYGEFFDENLEVKKELYQIVTPRGGDKELIRLRDEATLLELEDIVREASDKVKQHVYDNEDFYNYRRKQDKRIDSFIENWSKAAKKETKTVTKIKEKVVTVYVNQHEFKIDTDTEIPNAIKILLDTTLTETAKTKVQLLSNDNERHFVMNLETFIEQNVESLSSWTQEDVNQIIEFYQSSGILPGTNMATLWTTVQQLSLAYLLRMDGKQQVMFSLSEEQRQFAIDRLKAMASKAGTELQNWRQILDSFKAEQMFVQAALKISDIKVSPATQGELEMAVNSGDIKRIQRAKERAYREVVENYRGRKRTLWSQLLRFERTALLSSPGTWVRNQVSNVALTGINSLTDLMSRMFPQGGKAKKLNQYKIAGTKIDGQYKDWVQTQIFDSGFIDLLGDALSKYDVRKKTVSNTDVLVTLITEKIETDLFNKDSFRSAYSDNKFVKMFGKGMQFTQWFTNFVMQDTWAINNAFKKYLGKMLTEDQVDVSKGLTKEVMTVIADAYVMAAQDFMHKPGMWSKMEHALKNHLHNHFGANTADAIYFMYKQIFPFGASSWNWFVDSLEFTPIGLFKGLYNMIKLESTVKNMEEARRKGEKVRSSRFAAYLARRQLTRGMLGSATLALGIILHALGYAAVDDDDDEPKLVFNGKDGPLYVDIRSVYGTSGLLAGITIAQGAKDNNTLIKVFSDTLTTMFHESTFSDLFNSFRYNETFGEYLVDVVAEVPGMLIPRFISGTLGVATKYKVQYSPGMKGALERFALNAVPFLSYTFARKVNPYTGDDEMVNDAWVGSNLINKLLPVKVKNYDFSDAEWEAAKLGIRKSQLKGSYEIDGEKITLSSKDVQKLNQFYGKLNKISLNKLINDEVSYTVEDENGNRVERRYSKMTDKQKAAVIERIMSNNSGYAKAYVLTSSGQYKYYANDSEYEVLKKLGLTNVYRQVGKYKGYVKN